jgi:hypothetical protein
VIRHDACFNYKRRMSADEDSKVQEFSGRNARRRNSHELPRIDVLFGASREYAVARRSV